MAFTIQKPKPFIIKGQEGEYIIPAFSMLSTDEVGDIMTITPEMAPADRVHAIKAFLLKMAPDLEKEGLGDIGYSQIFQAYEKEQNLGK